MKQEKNKPLLAGVKRILKYIALALGVLVIAIAGFYFWASSSTLGEGETVFKIFVFPSKFKHTPPLPDTFTIMTYNIGYLSGMTNNRPVKTDQQLFDKNMNKFVEFMKKINPHFIAFQEIDYRSQRSFYQQQFKNIARKGQYRYGAAAVNWDKKYVPFPFGPPSVHFGRMLSGQAIVSRWPIRSTERFVLQKPKNNPFYYNRFYLDRLAQVATIEVGEHRLAIINVHLEASHQSTRQKHVKKVLEIYNKYKNDHAVLLLGDFNAIPPNAAQKKNFSDEPETDFSTDQTIPIILAETSLRAADLEYKTFPSENPTRKLDYIFYNHQKIEPVNVFVPQQINSSDHFPLVMQFRFK